MLADGAELASAAGYLEEVLGVPFEELGIDPKVLGEEEAKSLRGFAYEKGRSAGRHDNIPGLCKDARTREECVAHCKKILGLE